MPVNPDSPRSRRSARLISAWRPIIAEVSASHGVSQKQVLSGVKTEPAVTARHEIFSRLSDRGISFTEIGRRLGGFDRTTVRHGVKKWAEKSQGGRR